MMKNKENISIVDGNALTKPFVAKRLHFLFIIEVVCKKWQIAMELVE